MAQITGRIVWPLWWRWLYWPLTRLGLWLGLPLSEDRFVEDGLKSYRIKWGCPMASAGGIDVKGLKEAQRLLEELPKTIAKRVLRKSLVRGAQPIKDEAEDLAPEDQGDLKDSIAIRSKRARPLEVGIDVGPDVKKAPHAHLVEFDTRPHLIKPVRGHTLTLGPITVTGAVQHPGTTGQPFMRPAFDNKEREARTIVGRVAGVETEKAAVRLARRRAK